MINEVWRPKFGKLGGIKQNIPPYIIGGVNNIEIIDSHTNLSKGQKCSTTINELFKNDN